MPPPPRPPRPPGVQSILDEIAQRPGGFASLDALNAHLARRMQEYNATPQPELGGLSPIQVQQLLTGDWATTGALRVADDASLEELHNVPFLADARALMRYVAQHAPVKLTSLGNLSRAAVAALVPQLRMVADEEEDEVGAAPIPPFPIRNEGDALWLGILRHVLLFAKVIARRKGLVLTKRGQQLLDDGHAWALYALLFRTFFRQFDLRFLCNDDRHPGLQQTLAWSFCQLGRAGNEWASAESLAARAWLDSARDPMDARDREFGDMRHWAFQRRVLQPLVMFGLLERRREPGTKRWEYRWEFRPAARFERVLRFEFQGGGRGDLFLMR
ncbi:MAG TPA: hypothetical protein PKC83_16995 [Gemmatimonadaceae bacterium]|nr:hypothetical protein [Gemmatimonadaceae bacterium]